MKAGVAPLLLAALFVAAPSPAWAVLASYPHPGPDTGPGGANGWEGTSVWFLEVAESNDAGRALFEAPIVAGDSIDFSPREFVAESQGGGSTTLGGDLGFTLLAKPGHAVQTLQYAEAGEVTLAGSPSSDDTWAQVTANVTLEVVEVDGAPLVSPVSRTGQLTFLPSDGDYFLNTDTGGGFFLDLNWAGDLTFDVETALTEESVPFALGATRINVQLDTTLIAESVSGSISRIELIDLDGVSFLVNVPEPTLAVVYGAFGVLLAAQRRRAG